MGIPDPVVQVVQKMMAKEREDRYATCAELLVDLERVLASKPPSNPLLDVHKSNSMRRGTGRKVKTSQYSTVPRNQAEARRADIPRELEKESQPKWLMAG